ncbi:LTA synthase family protein [Vibrio rumoiensis]|uniref:LTA synthase family protein n=1 Tax=Vibrio rumoiensis TaxID=76258 RepID=UPI003AA90891
MSRNYFLHNLKNFCALSILATLILTIARCFFLLQITDITSLSHHISDLSLSLITGLRFDLKVAVIAYSPVFLFGSLFAYDKIVYKKYLKILTYYVAITLFMLVSISIANYFFYNTYGNYFDVFMFSFLNEEKKAVMTSMWQDYPVVYSLIASSLITLACLKILKKHSQSLFDKISSSDVISNAKITTLGIVSLILIILFARGSIGTFPLGRYDANVSTFTPLNTVTPNAFMAIDWARKDYQKQSTLKPIDDNKLTALMTKVIGQSTPIYHTQTNTYLEQKKPNVVLALMESMGTNFLVDDNSEKNDLLGSLRQHFSQDFLFTRFQAGTSGTWDSIMMMLTQTNHSNISQSAYKNIKLQSLATLPYTRAGYEVSFVYAGASTWRNSKPYLLNQGFDHFYDHDDILKQFPKAKENDGEWGLADEYAFKFTQHLLSSSHKPQMIFLMSLTNHPPFKLPPSYQPKAVELTKRLKENVTNDHQEALVSLQTYQYASNALGDFITQIKQDPSLKDNTIIAASGDHHTRSIKMDLKNEYAISYAVPFYLYIPDEIKQHVHYVYDNKRIGSHRDIFPTLYSFSLSDAEYITLGGENLFSNTVQNIGYNEKRVITTSGAYSQERPQDLYPWAIDKVHTETVPTHSKSNSFLRDYNNLQDMYIRYLVNQPQT